MRANAVHPTGQADPAFALALHRCFAKSDHATLLSPVSVSLALRPLLLGARGDTAAGIARALAGGEERTDATDSRNDFRRLVSSEGWELSLAISLWLDEHVRVDAAFADAMNADPLIHRFDVDFAQAEAVRERINGWTEERTKGRIRNLLPPGSIDPMTRLVSTSAVHFQERWQVPFDEENTAPLPFTRADGSHEQTSMMRATRKTRFARGEEGRMLQLDYRNWFTFQALLPDSPSGLEQLETRLTPAALSKWTDSLETCEVDIRLPKFQQEAEYHLAAGLSELGMASAFDPARADFSGIGSCSEGRPLYLASPVHKTFIDMNEEGTEAAAATALNLMAMELQAPPRREEFHADHPFLYMIRTSTNGSILFIGRMTGR